VYKYRFQARQHDTARQLQRAAAVAESYSETTFRQRLAGCSTAHQRQRDFQSYLDELRKRLVAFNDSTI